MSKDPGTANGGLLSKVVRFVKSPTTHWADLDRPVVDEGDSESRLALKEMIERKRRNDFVRNREFDMLRKVRRRETLKDDEAIAGGPSFYSSSLPANTGERARTLKKIDEIEEQMSTAWFKRQQSQRAAAAAAAGQTAVSAPADDRADPVSLASAAADGLAQLPPAFAPTLTMDQVVLPEAVAAAPVPTEPAFQTDIAESLPMLVSPVTRLLGDVPEFNVDVMAAAKQDPEIEEAAMRFANGDAAGAEAVLLGLVAAGGSRRDDEHTWLTLFDLYRCVGDQTKFDDAAFDFAALFGRSAPQWSLVTEPVSARAPITASAPLAAPGTGLSHWVSPSTVGTQSMAALRATLERQAPPWRIDWRHIKTIEPAALPALVEVLDRWGDVSAGLQFLGTERLLELLTERSPTDDRSADPLWWNARLGLLRVLGDMDEFELVALNYCVTYEVSPPAWEEPKCRFSPMAESGQAALPSQIDPVEDAAPAHAFGAADVHGGDVAPIDGIVKAALEGSLVGSADAALQPLAAHAAAATAFELNCRKLLRVDFGAAGDLLNWSMEQQTMGRHVSFKQVNRLVAAFFGVIGITDAARVMLRTD